MYSLTSISYYVKTENILFDSKSMHVMRPIATRKTTKS